MEPASIDNLCILYQSPDFIVVNKHWDIRIDSKRWYEKLTVQSQLKHRFPELADPETYYGFRFCHQLDFSTSGSLCVALNKAAAGKAYKCFKDRRVRKAYLALVRDHVREHRMTLDYAIGKNTTEGRTHMMCIEGTLGRTHQLRVHCSAVGHPIAGDFTYSFKKDSSLYRMMLHAYYLEIPIEGELIEVTAPDPFLTSIDEKWAPQTVVNLLDDIIQELKNTYLMEETKRHEALVYSRESKKKIASVETEEQVKCVQWLSEWPLE